jgi:hypothetical protein
MLRVSYLESEVQQTLQQIKIPTQGIGLESFMPLVLSIGMRQMSLGLELFAQWRSVCTLYNDGQLRRGEASNRIVMPLK